MRKIFLLATLFAVAVNASGQKIPAYTATDVMHVATSADTVYVINFWATWCAPCVQELPEFNAVYDRYADKPVKVLMVSLDFKEDYPNKLAMFIKRKNLRPEVAWLMDTDPNIFIPRIEETWQGSIPATLIVMPGRYKKFVEGQVTAAQLSGLLDKVLQE